MFVRSIIEELKYNVSQIKHRFTKIKFLSDGDYSGDRFHTKEYIVPIVFGLLVIHIILEQRSFYKWKVFITLHLFGIFSLFRLDTTVQDMPSNYILSNKKDDIFLGFINGKEAAPPLVKVTKHI